VPDAAISTADASLGSTETEPTACASLSMRCGTIKNALEREDCETAASGVFDSACEPVLATLQDGGVCP